ncbi:hypothetical protein HK101_007641 [Irineochytrium annulatum]|nr:hypothetical protein HK101_007641 [Irineochytrium annulatum]
MEYIPYRKRDFTAHRDEGMHPFVASRGYVVARVDMRGTGDSTGMLEDEYSPTELEDALSVLRWMSKQPWCTGSLGMMGKSWGGFNSLQVACLQPPELRCIITVCSTDDRYADDIHYAGGCLLTDNLTWASFMLKHTALPPDPGTMFGGDGTVGSWRDTLKGRILNQSLWGETWHRHRKRDWFWKHGSVCEDYSRIKVPVFCVGGWQDSYTRAVFNLMERLKVPRRALVGPWTHFYMEQAPLQVYVQEYVDPSPIVTERPGRWVDLNAWPSNQISNKTFHMCMRTHVLTDEPVLEPDVEPLLISNDPEVGSTAGRFCAFGIDDPDMPADQTEDDERSLCFESAPANEAITILGAVTVNLPVTSSEPEGMVVARLCDVSDRGSFLIGWGPVNLTQYASHAEPSPFPTDGPPVSVHIQLKHCSHVLPRDHRLRLSLSTSYWPRLWPSREVANIRLHPGGCIQVPVYNAGDDKFWSRRPLSQHLAEPARSSRPRPHVVLRAATPARSCITKRKGIREHVWLKDEGAIKFDVEGLGGGWVYGESSCESYTRSIVDPTIANVDVSWRCDLGRPEEDVSEERLSWAGLFGAPPVVSGPVVGADAKVAAWKGIVRIESRSWLSSTRDNFNLGGEIRAYENGKLVVEKIFDTVVLSRERYR